ncbi:unnamed protein product [Laminaria digitata]
MARDDGGRVATDSTGCSATTAFSASSILREVPSLGSPTAIEPKSAPPPPPPPNSAAKPPTPLVKVKTGRALQASTVNAAVVVGLPCRFTLRGMRQTQETPNNSDDDGRRATMAYTSPRRRPLLRRVVIGTKPGNAVGYSPRLRAMGAESFTEGGDTTFDFFVEPSPRTPLEGESTAAGPFRLTPGPHRARITPCGGCFHIDAAGANAKSNADFGGIKARTHEGPYTGHVPIQEYRCGRLRKGTTAASPKKLVASLHDRGDTGGGGTTSRPLRTLFLVSGQQQQIPVDAAGARRFSTGNMAPLQRRSQSQVRRCKRSHAFPGAASLAPPIGGRAKTVPSGEVGKSRSGGCNWDGARVSGDEDNGRERDEEVLLPESTSGPADEELCDAASAEATAGKGFASSGKRVLHVRVPRPPPASRLLLRPAPPRTSVLRSKFI